MNTAIVFCEVFSYQCKYHLGKRVHKEVYKEEISNEIAQFVIYRIYSLTRTLGPIVRIYESAFEKRPIMFKIRLVCLRCLLLL